MGIRKPIPYGVDAGTPWLFIEWMVDVQLSFLNIDSHLKGVCIHWNEKESILKPITE